VEGILGAEKLVLFLVFIVPGFVSIKVWNLIFPSEKKGLSENFFEALSYGCINLAFLFFLINCTIDNPTFRSQHPIWTYIAVFSVLFLFPVIWPILFKIIINSECLKKHVVHPTPTAWDHFFSFREPCFVLIHLKNGGLIGGLYGGRSFASSFPQLQDIYLEEVWQIDEQGCFKSKIDNSKGVLISKDFFDYIELFEPN